MDANRFNLHNRAILEEAPLQAYATALAFSPKKSLVRECYQDHFPTWLKRDPIVEEEWGPALQTLEGHKSCVTAVAFSPNGRYLASVSWDSTVRLWDPTTGTLRSTLAGHSRIAFSGSSYLATLCEDHKVRIWDPVSGVTRHALDLETLGLRPETDYLRTLQMAFTPNDTLAMGSGDGRLHTWDPETSIVTTLDFPGLPNDLLAFSPKGNLAITRVEGKETETFFYEPNTGATHHISRNKNHDDAWDLDPCLAFSSEDQIALRSDDNAIALYDIVKESHRRLDAKNVTALAFSPDSKFLAVACDKYTIAGGDDSVVPSSLAVTLRSWDLSTLTERLIGPLPSRVQDVAFSPDGRQLAFTCRCFWDFAVHIWDPCTVLTHKVQKCHLTYINSLVFSRDGKHLASCAMDDYAIGLWYPESGKLRHTLTGHLRQVRAVAFSPDSQQIASASEDGAVRVWDPARGTLRHILGRGMELFSRRHTKSLVYANDSKELACGSIDGLVRIWNPANGDLVQILQGHESTVDTVAFSPNGQVLASIPQNGALILWNSVTGDPLHKLDIGHQYGAGLDYSCVAGLAFSSDGQYLASVNNTKFVAIWDPITGQPCRTLESLTDETIGPGLLAEVAFSADNRLLAVSHYYGNMKVWNLATGEHLETLHFPLFNIPLFHFPCSTRLSFSSDGTYLEIDQGRIAIGQLLEDAQRSCPSSDFRWRIVCDWLMQGSREMLWLPPDFRPSCCAYRNNLFVLGRKSGDLTFLEVDPSYRPPE